MDRPAGYGAGDGNPARRSQQRDRQDAYARGRQLAEMRVAAGVTQAELASVLGVSQTRISKIEHGEISRLDVVRSYVAALGGDVAIVVQLGDRVWNVT
jgi:DNA-binding XRE family transcriptional regulator